MRVVFAGTPPFAAASLEAILGAGHDVPLVLSQPDRPAGRGMRLTPSAVSEWAASHGLAVHKPVSLKVEEAQRALREARPDVMVVAAYGLILPQAVLDIPPLGCLNIHASLLPRWRGAAPIQRAILAGDAITGVDIMRMEAGLDTGPVLLERRVPIEPRDTTGSLGTRLARLGAQAIVEALARLPDLQPHPQDPAGALYAPKVARAEATLDWGRSAAELDRCVRAFNPSPGAETRLEGQPLKIWAATPCEGHGTPGEVLAASGGSLRVACGSGALELTILQRPGGKRLSAAQFLQGHPLEPGARVGA